MNIPRIPLLILGALAAVLILFVIPNVSNVRVDAGYASYVFSQPIFGKARFKEVLLGPSSTGLRWRLKGQRVSVTPFTYTESFQAENAILAKDKLPLSSNAHIVWRLKPDQTSICRFLQEFGGWENAADPDRIAKQAYDQFIREPFRTITRSVVAKYDGLSVNESLPAISKDIESQVKDLLRNSPFEVMSVVMGNANPPEKVITAIATKVALNQLLEQKAIEDQIAQKNIDIERRNGEAAGAKAAAEAVEKAKAIAAINAVLTPVYIQYLQAENIRGAERVYLPLGQMPQLLMTDDRKPASK
jgi:hypothetical protein